ncbi:MAG: hypothetical protein JOZ03_11495 [Gammaproteobacteria bacterium]|nr:hypothetical protein [Gammaproteobacteria bacterium]
MRETGTHRVDEHQVAAVEQPVLVVDEAVRRGVGSGSPTTTRFGPSAPMCSHSEEEPGPPLKAKVIGRAPPRASRRV